VVPWFPFDPIGGFLIFVSSLHHWILFRESLSCTIPSGACQSHTSVWSLQYFHLSPSKYLAFCYSSCWMMGDALIPSFQWISSYRLQHIFLWDRDLESFLVPWGLQSSVAGSLTIDSGNTSMSPDR
jgi:hypothetical protein